MRRVLMFAMTGMAGMAVLAAACSSSESGLATPTPSGASSTAASGTAEGSRTASAEATAAATPTATGQTADHDDPADYEWNEADVVDVTLAGSSATVSGTGVTVDGSTVTVTAEGTYRLSGSLSDGQVLVDTGDEGVVRLLLDGVDIRSSSSAPLAVLDAKKVVVLLVDGSENRLVDPTEYEFPDAGTDEPNAALFSSADLTIGGSGSLEVQANFNDAIASKDGLVISGGTISVEAADDGIRGKDYLVVAGGTITVDAGGDGLKADNDEDPSLGSVAIEGGELTITAGGDGIDAETSVLVAAGSLTVETGGGSSASLAADVSAKAIKGAASVQITGGMLMLDAADDAIHSNVAVGIAAGEITIATGDDAIHADITLTIDGGAIDISKSYEGIESAAIVINGGDISVVSSDDGLNAAGGVDGSGVQQPGGRTGRDTFGAGGNYSITINGGTILVSALGDGIDANGSITMTAGTVVVQGPTANNNGAVDYDGQFTLTGGVLAAAGSAGMAQAPGTTSTQGWVAIRFGSAQPAGTLVHIRTASGDPVATFRLERSYQALVVSTPDITSGETYEVYTGGSSTGTDAGGLYEGGAYSGGAKVSTVTAGVAIAGGMGPR